MAEWRLSETEQRVWSAFTGGEWVDLRTGGPGEDDPSRAADWDEGRVVRGEVIAALLLGAVPPDPGRRPAIRLRGARIEGRLDLMGAEIPYTVVCEHCHFDGPIRLVEATARTIRLTGSDIHSINAPRLVMDGLLNLYRSTVRHGLRLERARVNGEITLRDARIGPDAEGIAVAADGLVVDGEMEANDGFRATGVFRLRNARIEGRLGLENAVVEAPGRRALALNRATVKGGLLATGITVEGETAMRGTRIEGEVRFDGARLRAPGGIALAAGGMVVEGPFLAQDGFTAEGQMRMPGAQIRTFLTMPGASVSAPGGTALWLDQLSVNDVDAADLTVTGGTVRLAGAQVGNDLTLAGARLDGGAEEVALAADNITVGATFDCRGLRARGEVHAVVARIGGRLLLTGARLEHPTGTCLRLSRADIGADLFGRELTAVGRVKLEGARVGGRVDLEGARLDDPRGTALDARSLQAGELLLRPAAPIGGTVTLEHARIGLLRDDPDRWPEALSLNGLTYESLEPRLPAQQRLRWLALDPDGYQPQPYEHLAAFYAALGQVAEARRVLLAKERAHRRGSTPMGRVWALVQDATVAYGYQPWRALLWLALLVTAGAVVYGAEPPKPLKPGEAPHFNPVVYTLDLLIPLVDLGQERAFNPAGGYQWLSYALVAAGWILVTVIAAAVARVLSRR
ncbi:hypothetical protein [Actinomadura rugatobispora]|uniref:Oxidoreductase n=1 Tax=Actinomadura rugatobispora TaxID=1994 RepID=A0ABW1A0F2_9ACTN|nr:oxidoreductase [Actinomadura rugatobispora]